MSIDKTLDILDLFSLECRTLTVPEIAERLGQPQSSVYRNLRVLKERGYITESNAGYYKLGYRFLYFAKIVRAENNLVLITRPVLEGLTKEIGETSILLIRSKDHAVCLDAVPSFQAIKVSSEQGAILPLHTGASSKALLAFQEDGLVDELYKKGLIEKYTENTIYDLNNLKAEMMAIREKGYAVSDGEIDEGAMTYGVPIYNMDNNVIASLSIAGPRERMLQKDKDVIINSLKAAVKEIQQNL